MSSIDSRVVEAKFDNRQFQAGVKGTLDSLDSLKKGLKLDGATKGLDNIDQAAKRISMQSLASNVEQIASKFSAMGIIGVTALANIATQALHSGEALAKSFSFGPITDGLNEYETNLNSIQTILSNTQWQGATLDQVNGALNELNIYSDKTIYNFSEMARNIGTFTSAGVKLDTSVNAIKGIANLAAISGSSADQASTAMYQLSQALSTGTVKLMDWNSVVNAGMGGKVFQDALKETARTHGVAVDAMIKKDGSFRDSLQEGWLTSKILTETLSKFTGDLSASQLKSMGYTKEQAAQIIKMGQTAQDAATKIKTFHQLVDTIKEALGSGWTQTWQLIFGDFGEAKAMWTGAYNVLNGMVSASANMRNHVLGDWKKLGGRSVMIDAISLAFKTLMTILHTVEGAFREVFPRKTGQDLYNLTVGLHVFIENLMPMPKTLDNIKRTLAGFFAVMDIGWQIVKAGIHFIADLFSMITKGEGSGGFLGMTANIGDFLVALDKAIKQGQGLTKFFHGLEHVLAVPIALVKALADALFHLFDFHAPSSTTITKSFTPLGMLGHEIITIWDEVIKVLDNVFHAFSPLADKFTSFFGSIGKAISDALGGINYEDVLHTINTGLFAGLVLLVKKMVGIFKGGANAPQGFVNSLMSPFQQMTNTLKTMQNTLRATTLLEIAAAVGILAASTVALSNVDAAGLTRALTAMTVMFGQLFTSMIIFDKIGGVKGIGATAVGLILFATAIRILTSSVTALSKLSWNDLAKGLIGVTVLLGGLTLAVKGMGNETAGMVKAGAGLALLAIGVKLLADAVTQLSGLSWGELAKGLVGVGALLVSLTLFTKFAEADKGGIAQGAGLILLGTAIKILASAVQDFAGISWEGIGKGLVAISAVLAAVAIFSKGVGNPVSLMASGAALVLIAGAMNALAFATAKFGSMNWGEIAKGLISMAGALGIIVIALNSMPLTSVLSAAALVAVAGALVLIGQAVAQMGGMSWEDIAKGLITLAGALTIISIAMDSMMLALPGAAALLVIAAALAIFVPELMLMGSMSWEEIGKGLITLAGAFAVLGVAGLLLTPVIPSLLGLGAAITLLGVGVALIGGGVLALSAGLTALAAAGGAVTLALVAMVSAILGVLPVLVKQLGLVVIAFAETIAVAAPSIGKAMTAVLLTMLKVIRDVSPQIIRTFGQLLVNLLAELAKDTPKMANSAFKMFIGILKALEQNEPEIVQEMINLLVGLLNELAKGVPRMATAATNLIVALLHGIAAHVGEVITAGTDIIIAWIQGIGQNGVRIANAALDAVVDFINGIADAIDSHVGDLRSAGLHMAEAMLNGMTLGLSGGVGKVASMAKHVASSALGAAKKVLGIFSPSREFRKLGEWVVEGFVQGLNSGDKKVINTTWHKMNELLDAAMTVSEKHLEKTRKDLYDVTHARDADTKSIRAATVAYAKARAEHKNLSDTVAGFNDRLTKEKDLLNYLNYAYSTYDKRIQDANKSLKEAIKTKDDFFDSVKGQYQTLPDISDTTSLDDYMHQIQYQIDENKRFTQVLLKLKHSGLNDQMYKELLSKGTASLPLAEQILAGGKDAIDEINNLDKQLYKSADRLGASTALQLQIASVREAKGVVDKLHRQKWLVGKMTDVLANNIVGSLKRSLKDKSTPAAFAEHGKIIVTGFSAAVARFGPAFDKIGDRFGVSALAVMRRTISKLASLVNAGDIDLHPKIAPVLDLSAIERDAPRLYDLLAARRLAVDTSYSSAKDVSAKLQQLKLAQGGDGLAGKIPPRDITFIQNNMSPKALSQIEIYRQTKNQLSKAKGALTTDAA